MRGRAQAFDYGAGAYWLWSSGFQGYASTDCVAPWIAIAGGAYSKTATDIGTGYPDADGSSWDVSSSDRKATVVAYALCAYSNAGTQNYFYRVTASVSTTRRKKKTPSATATCAANSMLIAGWAQNATFSGPLLEGGKPIGWIAGGKTTTQATAECATQQEWSVTGITVIETSKQFTACDGDNDDVIGGFFGKATSGGGTAQPNMAYPGTSSTPYTNDPTGLWFASRTSITGYVACQEDLP